MQLCLMDSLGLWVVQNPLTMVIPSASGTPVTSYLGFKDTKAKHGVSEEMI